MGLKQIQSQANTAGHNVFCMNVVMDTLNCYEMGDGNYTMNDMFIFAKWGNATFSLDKRWSIRT